MEVYQCSLCDKTFGRQEHLRRHENSHKEPQFRCDRCSKNFHRKDALNKHEQTHQLNGTSLLKQGARACSSCASMKTRCTGTVPCMRCSTKRLQCVYPVSTNRSTRENSASQHKQDSNSLRGPSCSEVLQHQLEQPSLEFTGGSPVPRQMHQESIADSSPYAQSVSNHIPAEDFVQQPSYSIQNAGSYAPLSENEMISTANWTANALSTINWLQSDITNFNDDDFNNLFACFSNDFPFSPSIDFVSPTQQLDATTGLSTDIAARQGLPQVSDERSNFQQASPIVSASIASNRSTVASGEYYVDGDAGRLPKAKRRKIVVKPRRLEHAADPDFSLEYHGPITTCPVSRLMLSDELYAQICALCHQICLRTTTFKPFLLAELPSKQALEGLLFNYFAHFDQTIPFLHFPTFRTESSHCALLLAMMAVGSCFVDGEETEIFTLSMHETVRRYLIVEKEQKEWPRENSLVLAQVHLLHTVGAGYTQLNSLHASASGSLHQATKICRDTWALQERVSAPDPADDPDTAEWLAWIKKEEWIRTGFCIWMLDCMWAFHFQQPPHLSLDHATTMQLPCSESQWSAKILSDWKRLTACGTINTPTLLEALQNLYIDKRLPPNLGEFSCILLIHGLIHRTWEVSATVTQSLSSLEPSAQKQASRDIEPSGPVWPPSVPLFNRWRNSACDCLDILHWRANEAIGAACGMEHPTVLHLHSARVVLLGPMRHIILFSLHLIRTGKDATELFPAVSPAKAEEHRRLIQRWALRDQYKARLAAIHAGVVFWHVRLYSINGFHEPTAVAFATLLLWALSLFSTKRLSPSKTPTHQPRAPTTSVTTSSNHSSPSPDICDIILIDRPTDDELVQQFVREGNTMHANMTGVGDLFGPKGPRKVLAEGQKLLSTLRSWRGVTEYWIRVFGRLEKVTAMVDVEGGSGSGNGNGNGNAVT